MFSLLIKRNTLLIFIFLTSGLANLLQAGVSSPAHIHRMSKYDVKFYWLDLEIQKNSQTIRGNALTRANCVVNSLDTFALELAGNLTIDSIRYRINNGPFQVGTYTHTGQEINVLLSSPLTLGQQIETRVFYHGNPTVSVFYNSGFYSGNLGKFSASPPYNSVSWWPCKQNLSDQADSSWFFITTNAADRAISNGLLTNLVDVAGGKKRWEWKSKYPINFYLIAFVVTSEQEVIDYWHPIGRTDSLLLTYYGYTPANAHSILQVYSDKFGLYPFYNEKLAFAKVNLQGGIENQTLIASNGGVDEHEIAHQWFGNHAGCRTWKDVMLSEGFSTWAESVYAEFMAPNATAANQARMSYYTDNTTTSTVYGGTAMDTNTVLGVFGNSNLYYKKAAMVINSLRFHINNDDMFFQAVRNYLQQYGGNTANAEQLRASFEATTGVELVDFFNQWYYKGGAPTFNIAWNQINNTAVLQITQTSNSGSNPLFKTPVELRIQRAQGDTIVRLFTNANLTTHQFFCPGTITGFTVDPNQWITNGNGTVTFNPSLVLSSDEQANSHFQVYPNPCKNFVMIASDHQSISSIKIYNLLGELVHYDPYSRLNTYISVEGLAKGSYIVCVDNDKYSERIKLLVE